MLGCARFRGIEMKRIVLIIFMLLVPASAFAQTDADIDTFRYLASVCRDVDQSKALTSTAFNTGFCLGYLSGVINSMKLIPRVVCIPGGVTIGDAVKVILKYADAHPEKLYFSSWDETVLALSEAFPCPKDK